jgi:NAD(P)-dependent dehydrogenase (short-subunit alcohol dehydrogenase family)
MRLKDKVAIVTGGADGIGAAYCRGFADEGAKIVIADIKLDNITQTIKDYEKRGIEALAIKTDVSDADSTLQMAAKVMERFGRIDILVNNAAVMRVDKISRNLAFYELDLAEWDHVMAVNVKGTLLCSRAVFPHMKATCSGKIINVAAGQFFRGGGAVKYAHYVASKGAIIGLTRAMAREAGDFKINVNCICPGYVLTGWGTDPARMAFGKIEAEKRCIKRDEHPDDLIGTAVFLASKDSDFITGQTIVVDGGEVML